MTKSYETSFIKKITFIILILIISFFSAELLSRIFIFFIVKDYKTFQYGFNNNIKIDINHLIKFKINLIDLRKLNLAINNKENKTKKTNSVNSIWAFGGSTTKGNFCGDNASSWPQIISDNNKNFDVLNFGQNGIDSYASLQILQKKSISEKNLPQSIFWAHKFNEINVIYQGVKKDPNNLRLNFNNNKKRILYFKILQLEKTVEKYSLFYKILKNVIITSNRKIIRNFTNEHINPNLKKEDFVFAAKNYEFNTSKAIELAKKLGIKNFYIISLPSTKKFEDQMKGKFFTHYYASVQNLINNHKVKFIDLSQKEIFLKDQNSLFCDETHKTLKANILVANFINSLLKVK